MARWRLKDIPDLSGKRAIVTGGNVGLGFKSVLELARNGAEVIIACRRTEAGDEAIERINTELQNAKIECIPLDLSDLSSVSDFAKSYTSRFRQLDILLNNAGVVNLKTLQHNANGHEAHMAINHYGHFALTIHLVPTLVNTPNARVVTVSSAAYRYGVIQFDDMDWRKRTYDRQKAYGDSKLANLLFTHALQSRFDEAGASALSVAAHPGLTGTERQQSTGIGGGLAKRIASPISEGVAPQLRAATDPNVKKRDVFGPRFGLRGKPVRIQPKAKAQDIKLAEQLWTFTENLVR